MVETRMGKRSLDWSASDAFAPSFVKRAVG